ncbi:hypothetical protein EKO04_008136 [Ascochyta lentis]|uniref:GPI anchored serine-threonine rich protein n=1 Tax=Ascochyta lentis TaxID=205686 RepID=A0A8H7MC89_9PLEO|nr:hypothetical protein EKO04_008136 [Ascochyta lentis]
MRTSTLVASLVALASTALAASDTCQAQSIVDACVAGYQDRIEKCNDNSNDWICLCDVYTYVLTCYNNCPDSNEKPPVQNQVTQYCTAAEPLRVASSASLASVAKTAKPASATSTSATTTGSATATGSGTAASASAFATGAASALTNPAGAAVVALVAAARLF